MWIEGGSLEDIIPARLNRKAGPRLEEFETPENALELWAIISAENKKKLSAAANNILERDYVSESIEYYRGMFHMVQRLNLKEVYPGIKDWFERNYYTLRKRKNVGAHALSALASLQSWEEPLFWEKMLIVAPEEWTPAAFSGLAFCSPREAVKNLMHLHLGIKHHLYRTLVRKLYNTIRHSNSKSSTLEMCFLSAKIKDGMTKGEAWAFDAEKSLDGYYSWQKSI